MTHRLRRLYNEYATLKALVEARPQIEMQVLAEEQGVPVRYLIIYNIRAMAGVSNVEHLNEDGVENVPYYADRFEMTIDIPPSYPRIDAMPQFNFRTCDDNFPDSFCSLAWCVDRVRQYLTLELYHAENEPPYPEDLKVAQWFLKQYK